MVAPNTAVGLTLRTFHTGGVVGLDITSGLPRVEELFEARTPKAQAIISEIDGVAEVVQNEEGKVIKVIRSEIFHDEYSLPAGVKVMVKDGQWVDIGTVLAGPATKAKAKAKTKAKTKAKAKPVALTTEAQYIIARVAGEVEVEDNQLSIRYEEKEEREYPVSAATRIRIQDADLVKAGHQLTDGPINPQDILHILGGEAVQQYLVNEVQKVYRSQGVNINDKHIEVIVHQMLSRVRIDSSGDTEGEPATAHTVLVGITRASLSSDSWLAAASFQETTRVLTEAAISGKVDKLVGLKENVIIGKLIPARYPASEEVLEITAGQEGEEVSEITAGHEAGEMPEVIAGEEGGEVPEITAGQKDEEMPEAAAGQEGEEVPEITAGQKDEEMPEATAGQEGEEVQAI
jgi:DNA-directed RNA polymerase subunit beta'